MKVKVYHLLLSPLRKMTISRNPALIPWSPKGESNTACGLAVLSFPKRCLWQGSQRVRKGKIKFSDWTQPLALLFILLIWAGCAPVPHYPDEPQITFVSLSRDHINQLDSVKVTFEFTDGDGDIGFERLAADSCDLCDSSCLTKSTFSLFVTDSRTGCSPAYHIPYIPPRGISTAISGKIELNIYNICCLSPSGEGCIPLPNYPQDTVIYTIQIKDRAGNISNAISTPPLYLRCDI